MSKLNQIENKIREQDGGPFQKLADAYLYKKGYENLNPLGSLIGTDKIGKGTPDTFISLPNGKYAFAEYTTQQRGLFDKLKSDLAKCFDESKTGMAIEKIEKIVFCHTSILIPSEEEYLRKMCQSRNVNINIFGIGPISFDLYQKYPGIAKDILGIEVDTGQLLTRAEFVSIYNKNVLSTPLDTSFHFRDKEISDSLELFEKSDLLIISGRAGVGKSRLALECCDRFLLAHSGYIMKCIFNKGPDIFEDLRVHFAEPGNYLAFVDDANRINRFEYVLQLLNERSGERRIKIIATVRDYALGKVKSLADSFGGGAEVLLEPFKDKEIEKIVEDIYGIHNHIFLERIAAISKGNPRLAVMAAALATKSGTFESITNVSSLYDEYYSSIGSEISDLKNPDLLKTAGLVAFFHHVDYTDKKSLEKVTEAFGINPEVFWSSARRLHELEIFDMYEEEVIRVSDQIISTYLFYLAFFKERVLDFSMLLDSFFPNYNQRFIDSMNPVLDVFYSENLTRTLRVSVDKIWEKAKEANDEKKLMHLMEMFFYLKETDTLLLARNSIGSMRYEPAIKDWQPETEPDWNIPSPSLLSILCLFRFLQLNSFKIAVGLLLEYLKKQPNDFPKILYILVDRFGFTHRSYLDDFIYQQTVVEKVLGEFHHEDSDLSAKLFLGVARKYLQTDFHTTESKGGREFVIINFKLPATAELFDLRSNIWKGVFELYEFTGFRDMVLSIIHTYATSAYHVSSNEVTQKDSELLIPFLINNLDQRNYGHCVLAMDYFKFLGRNNVEFDKTLQNQFRNKAIEISELFLEDFTKKENRDLGYEQYVANHKERIRDSLKTLDPQGFSDFLANCQNIYSELKDGHKRYQFCEGIALALLSVAERDPETALEVCRRYLASGDPFEIHPFPLVDRLVKVIGPDAAMEFLNAQSFTSKRKWLFCFFGLLKGDQIDKKFLSKLLSLFEESRETDLPHHLDFLMNYLPLDGQIVPRVVTIILKKASAMPNVANSLSMLFNPHTELCKRNVELFKDDLGLLKKAYFAVLTMDPHSDYNRQTLASILEVDKNFIFEYVDWKYDGKKWLSRHDDMHDYSFLWLRNDFKELMGRLLKHIYNKENQVETYSSNYLETFFLVAKKDGNSKVIRDRQKELILDLIQVSNHDLGFMKFIFSLVVNLEEEKRRMCLAAFLEHNNDFDDFKRLPIESHLWTAIGSLVPVIQKRIDFLDSLLSLVGTVELLQHRQYLEQEIEGLRKYMEAEKRRDFIDN